MASAALFQSAHQPSPSISLSTRQQHLPLQTHVSTTQSSHDRTMSFQMSRPQMSRPQMGPLAAVAEGAPAASAVTSPDVIPNNGAAVETYFKGTETVGSVMTSMVVMATPETLLGDILEHFAFYTGLPVADERTHHLVGMITNIDMYKKQRGKAGNVANTLVREVMTSPVVAVYPHTLVSYAAGLMLKYRVHRLPVIDREQRVVGIVTNEDLFETLTSSKGPPIDNFQMMP